MADTYRIAFDGRSYTVTVERPDNPPRIVSRYVRLSAAVSLAELLSDPGDTIVTEVRAKRRRE